MSREMKHSGVPWIGEIPRSWSIMPHKRVMHKVKEIQEHYNGENILSLTMRGVIVRDLDAGGKMPTTFDGYQKVYPNNLLQCLFDIDVTPRCVGLIKDEGLTSPAYSQFTMYSNGYAPYYDYLLRYMDDRKTLLHLSKNLRSSLTETDFGAILTCVPPIAEQKKIAEYLDKKCGEVDEMIALQEQIIEELKAYKQSVITEAVTKGLNPNVPMKDSGIEWIGEIPEHWEVKRLKYVSNISRGLFNHRPRNDERYYGGIHPFIQTGDVARSNKYIKSYSQTLSDLGISVSKLFPKGTLTMTIAANVGDVSILGFNAYFPDSVLGIIPVSGVDNIFLYYALKAMKGEFVNAAILSTQLNLNVERVYNMKAVMPPFSEQQQIASYLDIKCPEIDNLIALKLAKIEELKEYKKSIIYEYVTGKKEVV